MATSIVETITPEKAREYLERHKGQTATEGQADQSQPPPVDG